MEKLLELLNEFHYFNSDLIGYHYDEEYEKIYFRTELPKEQKEELKEAGALIDDGINEQWIEDEWIISKRFGFIRRLVENGKVETKRLDKIEIIPKFGTIGCRVIGEKRLLMLLSTQDKPLKFLISILK